MAVAAEGDAGGESGAFVAASAGDGASDAGCEGDGDEDGDAGKGAIASMGVVVESDGAEFAWGEFAGAAGGAGAVVCGETEGGETEGGAKVGGRPGWLASERIEREPEKKSALETKVKKETLRFRRDALALRNRFVHWGDERDFTWGRREFGAGVGTIASPLEIWGAACIFASRKNSARDKKGDLFGKSPMKF